MDLVNMTRIDGDQPVASLTKECPTCGKKDNNIVIMVSQNNSTQAASSGAAAISK
jgi:ribosomal protein S27AE